MDFGDFPSAQEIKSTRGKDNRPKQPVPIRYPPGFQFGYDPQLKRYGYLPRK